MTRQIVNASGWSSPDVRRRAFGLIAVLLGQFMLVLDATIVNVALPAIRVDLALAPTELAWVTTSYLIAFGGLLLLFGRLGDLFGRRRIFLAGLALFTLASIACGVAPDAITLIAARFVQGIGAAGASSVVLAIISTEFSDETARAKAMSGYMFVSVAGGSVGLLFGGVLTQTLGWHWIFLVNAPVGVLAGWLAVRGLRETPRARGHIDVLGAILVTAAAMVAIYGLGEAAHAPWSSPSVSGAFALTVTLVVVFFYVEHISRDPLVPLRVLRIRSLMVSSVVRGFMTMGLFGVFFIATLDMSQALDFGPLQVGLAFLPQTLTVAVLSLGITARVTKRFGPVRSLIGGLAIAAVGLAILASLPVDAPYFPLRGLAHVLLGLGFGTAFLPLLLLAMSEVPPRDAGLGSAIVNLSLQLSAAVDIAILVSASAYKTHALVADGMPLREATIGGYRFAYAIAIVGLLVGITIGAVFLRKIRSRV